MNRRYIGALLILPLLFPTIASASNSQPLSLTIIGGINTSGNQHYVVNQAGEFSSASIQGHEVVPSSGRIHYSLDATVHGLSAGGHAEIYLTGATGDGKHLILNGRVAILDMVPAEAFPVGCLSISCISAIPSAFVGVFTGSATLDGTPLSVSPTIFLESPFLNPFGNPIVLANEDSSLAIVTGYQVAKIQYNGVQSGSFALGGSLGATPVSSGTATLTTRAYEDLFAGTERESGTITFSGMAPSLLDATGQYSGSSIIPSVGAFDCTAFLPLFMQIFPTGLCTLTGFVSGGSFTMTGNHVTIKGTYLTVWDVPAVTFGVTIPPPVGGSSVAASVSSH